MNFKSTVALVGLLGIAALPTWAQTPAAPNVPGMTNIEIAGEQIPVVEGGMYDRYRSNPPLAVVAAQSPNTNLEWFKTLTKTKLDVGFETWSPNFYYENSKITAIFTADLDRLRELIPAEIREQVEPIRVWPGRGLVALTGYAYHYCDNDTYNEIGLSIVTSKPGTEGHGLFALRRQSKDSEFWGYVLKLPVDTDLARVRGVVGYNLPKWTTPIHYRVDDQTVSFEVVDHATGKTDIVFRGAKLEDLSREPAIVTHRFTNLGNDGGLTVGNSLSRHLVYGTTGRDHNVDLQLNDGSLSKFLKSLDLGEMVQYDYVPDFQMALYAPETLDSYLGGATSTDN